MIVVVAMVLGQKFEKSNFCPLFVLTLVGLESDRFDVIIMPLHGFSVSVYIKSVCFYPCLSK